ncbi:hypothetical protein A2962_03095 [Candidatus Woesebacteria bacterium RIFCSPLOWO2_01_FULL_39_61]|uniref:Uncharacterized protein n=1 Tax=Candidatus Woesebacteria bacterium RIFCSPHIGHO2_02_FULL_39_13 TaxID=1802505 RepID=A0A1F7Z126_9BACT|nr:MAG: hypothetical protein A2692_05975 [Candidatus Woesebacteria bacterium RIFCSPHIGHO2_01_FULL_39_95]OGM33164.1 MAG: hypothetical protein A3D01_04475 [Candidatus Woesebacteria bacterium RIFCSPHIGHO2_02_FULL_39_13]OGM36343.1 MAG: hypothetical protein A3E13_02815 [Candidatus Woesebacteria bacterium RIFCSPHIGHO2_12_FULL_40_20]OGM68405.1 MAG: hypothetical protein A2962_03095 [Candidatus Woesebacteria bacterium RIFCSPLOWO2_01_FULL_39_61]
MASLTQIAIVSRKGIRYGIYAIVLIIIARFVFNIGVSLYKKIFPPPPPEPTVAFGKLPKLPFPEKERPENLNYVLETPDGKLPTLPAQETLYFMPPISSSIDDVESAKTKAQALGFNPDGKPIAEALKNVYIFDKTNIPSTLTMNIITGIFSISYNLNADPSVISGVPPASDLATDQAKSYFVSVGISSDFQQGRSTTEFLKLEGGNLVKVDSQSDSELIKVNLFRENLGLNKDISSVTPDMPEANIWVIITGNRTIISAEYHYFQVDQQKSGTYPLKTADEAWEELKKGDTFIANLGTDTDGQITIRRVYLAYYDPGQYAEFYQPVVVFEGDGGFYAYVPAVKADLYGAEAESSE